MRAEEQRVKIAEACGFKIVGTERMTFAQQRDVVQPLFETPDGQYQGTLGSGIIPDYLNDLNAMHEAEKVLTDEQRWTYDKRLCVVVMKASSSERDGWLWHATAAQRAEAFLRTLNLWEEPAA